MEKGNGVFDFFDLVNWRPVNKPLVILFQITNKKLVVVFFKLVCIAGIFQQVANTVTADTCLE